MVGAWYISWCVTHILVRGTYSGAWLVRGVHVHSLFHIGVKRTGSIGDQTILVDDDVLKTIHDALITFMFDD